MSDLLRGGRLAPSRKEIIEFVSSIKCDEKILRHIIDINRAHVIMLVEKKIIGKNDGSKILGALQDLKEKTAPLLDVEDAHMLIEEEVIRKVGLEIGGNLNLAKSRNDQVATAIRMELRIEILNLIDLVVDLQESLLNLAEKNIETIIPGYTHLQQAQPTTFAHYLLAQFDILERSLWRFIEIYRRINLSPMGAGALATSSFPISRERVAELLGFEGLIENSLDAVSSRDFLLETLAALSIFAVDLSRFAEDLIIWSSMEFSILEIPDEFTSTSSIMPQKKNPEVLEIIRARMSHILGDFAASSTIMKALPSTYNMDFQEATPKLWDAIKTMKESLRMLSEVVGNLKVKENIMSRPLTSFLAATELANMLVRNYEVSFRTAHKIVGALVKVLIENGKTLLDATPELLSEVSNSFLQKPLVIKSEDLEKAIDLKSFIESHSVRGGPSKREVERMIYHRKSLLHQFRSEVSSRRKKIEDSIGMLDSLSNFYAAQENNRKI
ncbi:MAG: argininosuccinate lyase [Candidatus Bathyarchaeia archaeon]|nr:argininosuccinate lyase [Candidatus Bathyarchaeota archaeon]